MHSFDGLLNKPNFEEEVKPNTCSRIKKASDELLCPNRWDVLKLIEKYSEYNALGLIYTRDSGFDKTKTFKNAGGHSGAAHSF